MAHSTLHTAAISYLLAHQGEHLHPDRHRLVGRCADHLMESGISRDTATTISLQALGEVQARATLAHVDMTRSTSYAVFVVDPVSRKTVCFTAADLARYGAEQAEMTAASASTKH